MYCQHCGKEIAENSEHCQYCGYPVAGNQINQNKLSKRYNILCLIALVAAIISPVLGGIYLATIALILSIIGIVTFKKEYERGQVLGVIGAIVSVVVIVVYIAILAGVFKFANWAFDKTNEIVEDAIDTSTLSDQSESGDTIEEMSVEEMEQEIIDYYTEFCKKYPSSEYTYIAGDGDPKEVARYVIESEYDACYSLYKDHDKAYRAALTYVLRDIRESEAQQKDKDAFDAHWDNIESSNRYDEEVEEVEQATENILVSAYGNSFESRKVSKEDPLTCHYKFMDGGIQLKVGGAVFKVNSTYQLNLRVENKSEVNYSLPDIEGCEVNEYIVSIDPGQTVDYTLTLSEGNISDNSCMLKYPLQLQDGTVYIRVDLPKESDVSDSKQLISSFNDVWSAEGKVTAGEKLKVIVQLRQDAFDGTSHYKTLMEPTVLEYGGTLLLDFPRIESIVPDAEYGEVEVMDFESGEMISAYPIQFYKEK